MPWDASVSLPVTIKEAVVEADIICDAILVVLPATKCIAIKGERNLDIVIQTDPFIVDPAPTNTLQSFISVISVPLLESVSSNYKVGPLVGHVIQSQGSTAECQVLDTDVA